MDLDLDPDPWKWSVQDVQTFFRNDAAMYISDMPHGRLPPLDSFLARLLEHEISGADLLTTIDSPTLRDDCGVPALGARSAVLHCIKKLQKQSEVFASQNGTKAMEALPSLQSLAPSVAPQPEPLPTIPPPDLPDSGGQNARLGETQVLDARGRKRRKLDITADVTTLVSVPAAPKVTHPGAYLTDSACLVDEIFYGSTAPGQIIGDIDAVSDIRVLQADSDAGLEDQNFQFTNPCKPAGECRYVYSRLHHFFLNREEVELEREGRLALAIFSYRERDTSSGRAATVVQFKLNHEEPVAVREKAAYLSGSYTAEQLAEEDNGEWDFLLQKYATTNSPSIHMDSISDENDTGDNRTDGLSTTEGGEPEAIEDDEEDEQSMATERMREIIQQFINDRIQDWNEKLPDLEKKRAWTIWRKTKQSRSIRDELIRGAQRTVDSLTHRLKNMEEEYLLSTWTNDAELQKACGAMDPTIEDRELEKWKINVWQRRQEPDHVVRRLVNGKKATARAGALGSSEPALRIHPDDRLSVEPAPYAAIDVVRGAQDEIQYDADDDENYITPVGSPSLHPTADDFVVATPPLNDLEEQVFANGHSQQDLRDEEMLDAAEPNEAEGQAPDAKSEIDEPAAVSTAESLPDASVFIPRGTKTPTKPNIMPIDLTISSSDSGQPTRHLRTPKGKESIKAKSTPIRALKEVYADPNNATVSDIESWDYDELVNGQDRLRILLKLLLDAGPALRNEMDACRLSLDRTELVGQLEIALQAMRDGTAEPELLEDFASTMMRIAGIFLQWAVPAVIGKGKEGIDQTTWTSILQRTQLDHFTRMLTAHVSRKDHFEKAKWKPFELGSSSAPIDLSSSGIEGQALKDMVAPRKKGKRRVQRSATAQDSRSNALERQQRHLESQQTSNSAQIAAMIHSDPSNPTRVEINPARDANDEAVYLYDRIARRIKAHQIDGVRFLWREITADGKSNGQGCILAHTMGLGKTMQTIAVLVALEHSAQSESQAVHRQLPPHLRRGIRGKRHLRTLILCPPGLLQNWQKELSAWANGQLGPVSVIEASLGKKYRLPIIEEWIKLGGVLLIGYQMFQLLLNRRSASPDDARLEELDALEKGLLAGPDVVVADEAQMIKNPKAEVSMLTSRINTESRIALTGTPMSNDVDEIYALVSWVAPGFLGPATEFRDHYARPIEEGLWAGSTAYEKRKSLMKLKVLHHDIEPKINRANYEALRGSLKPKTEFVITLELTELQKNVYRRYIAALQAGKRSENAAQVTVFHWLDVLTLLATHPSAFRKKLLEPKQPRPVPGEDSPEEGEAGLVLRDSGEDTTPDIVDAAPAEYDDYQVVSPREEDDDGPAPDFDREEVDDILDGLTDDPDPTLSAKATVFLKLLEHIDETNDKVLVFSTSLRTLDYLGALFSLHGRPFERIDGKVKAPKRMEILSRFEKDEFRLLLISTKAGGVGLNIPSANRVFIFDFKFNPTVEEQAIGRAYRLGQTKPVYVYRFIAGGTFEYNLYQQALFKSSLFQRVVDKKNPRRTAERNAKDLLYAPKEVKQEDLAKWIGKDPMVLDLVLNRHGVVEQGVAVDTLIRSINTVETLQEEAADDPLDEQEQKEVNDEIELNKKRTRGRRAMDGIAPRSLVLSSPPSTMPPPPPPSTAPHTSNESSLNGSRGAVPSPSVPTRFAATQAPLPDGNRSLPAHPRGGLPNPISRKF